MKLEEVVPRRAETSLEATPGRTYHLRPINLLDEEWMKARFGAALDADLTEGRVRTLVAIFFHQLEEADKAFFAKQTVTIMNEKGESEEMELGGEKILLSLIQGPVDKIRIYKAVMITLGASSPMQDLTLPEPKAATAQKKTPARRGKRSSTSSRKSTAGRRNTR